MQKKYMSEMYSQESYDKALELVEGARVRGKS